MSNVAPLPSTDDDVATAVNVVDAVYDVATCVRVAASRVATTP